MSPPYPFKNDAFISYASEDRAWARKLKDSLERKGLRVFLDEEGLRVGDRWEVQLLHALENSSHLVLLWSNHSSDSAWVDEELSRFRTWIYEAENRQEPSRRKVVQILLEGEYRRMPSYQGIGTLAEEAVYAAGADSVPSGLWSRVVERVEETIATADDALPVPVLVLASTRELMEKVDADQAPPGGGQTMNQVLAGLSTDRPALLQRYGEERLDWRPFGSARPVREVLEQLKDELNAKLEDLGRPRLTWRYVEESRFWGEREETVETEVALLEARPALVVVDPLSFYDPLVASRYSNFLQPRFFADPDTFILVLAPFELPPQAEAVRATIRSMARQVFLHYYDPPVLAGTAYARCGVNVGDEMDFKGWLMSTIGPYMAAPPEPPQPPVLRAGNR